MRRLALSLSTLVAVACTGPAGQSGAPCSVRDNGDGTATISCPDGTSVLVTNGSDGANGTNGADGSPGISGTSCSVSGNPDAGTRTITCTDGTTVTLTDGRNGVDANAIIDFTLLSAFELKEDDFSVTVQSVSNAPRPVVQFTVRNRKGQGVKKIPYTHVAGISLLQLVPGVPTAAGNGLNIDTWVSHISNCATCTSSTESATASSLVDNGDGTYQYTFARDVVNPTVYDAGTAVAGVAFDANAVHRFALRLADPASDIVGQRVNSYRPIDVTRDYIPATGAVVDGQNDKVNTNNCLTCHTQFRAGALNLGGAVPFHGGQRYDVRYCVVCHNGQRKFSGSNIAGNAVIGEPTIDVNGNMTPTSGRSNVPVLRGEAVIDMPVFFHKIHAGEHLTLKGNYAGLGTEINEFNFPQDLRNCTKCHSSAAKADNWLKPSRRACNSCHDQVNFVTGENHNPASLAQLTDNACTLCHDDAYMRKTHLPVALPDPNSAFAKAGGSNNTHASWIGNVNNKPDGGRSFQYDIASVTTTDGGPTGVFPVVKFRFTERDAGVAFNVSNGTNELLDGFVGAPSVYCVFAVPQDNVAQPADFNVSMSGYLRSLWNGSATSGSGAGSLSGPDPQGYYTAILTGGRVPATASMLTCGLGYSYSLSSTLPLTQVNLPEYAFDAGSKTGGLSLPARNVWKVATGYTGRRGATGPTSAQNIVSAARCNNCHNELGITPNYHAGQRNDAATCSFCHTQNRTSSAWTAGSESFIHAIHAAKKRTVPFNWHAVAATEDHPFPTGFWGVEYPGRLNFCESCHNPGSYDFSGSWYTAANMSRRLMQTVATGSYDAVTPTADGGVPSLALSVSPYVVADGGVSYGSPFSYTLSSQAIANAAPSTLVISPIANTCFGCHDSVLARLHMEVNGGTIYGTRAAAQSTPEQCILCHGPGRTADIKTVHAR
jgi:OmcA/MtrC family decaheme c-type cytochrome